MKPARVAALDRRYVLKGLSAGAALSLASWPGVALGSSAPAAGSPAELGGTEFDLEIAPLPVNFTGRPRYATAINGRVPGPVLRMREGDTVTLKVKNSLKEVTSIHWHGVILPSPMDGVPGISFGGIAPGETFTYRFTLKQSGTYWYHAHTLAEQTGMFGAMVVEPRGPDPIAADRDYTVMLSDWTDESPLQVFLNLKKMGGYYNFAQPTVGDFFNDVSRLGLAKAIDRRAMWNRTRMGPTDYSDVSAATYTYLMNGTTPAGNWTAIAKPGERVRLRFVGAGTATYFDVRIPGLKLNIVSTDGQPLESVEVDEFRIAPGETYDVIVRMPDDRAYTIFAQSLDRTGFARGTLAPREGMAAAVPAPDPRVWLDPVDMMGAMAAMGSGHSGHGMVEMRKANHARTEYGANTDMRVDYPRDNLDDPGAGLRNNGRRALSYADLRTVGGSMDSRMPGREIELHLTGNMERFIWSLDGVKLNDARPIHFRENERLRITLVNDTTMAHPMHLHGMWSEIEVRAAASSRGSTRSRFSRRSASATPSRPTRRGAGRSTATSSTTWERGCSVK